MKSPRRSALRQTAQRPECNRAFVSARGKAGGGGGEIEVVERHELFAGSESRLGSLNTQRPGRVGSSMFRGRVGRERDFMRCETHNGDVTWECELHGPRTSSIGCIATIADGPDIFRASERACSRNAKLIRQRAHLLITPIVFSRSREKSSSARRDKSGKSLNRRLLRE